MAWRSITDDDLKLVLAGAELSGYRAAALAQDQADPVDATIQIVVDEIRGYVAGWAANLPLGPEGTIPDKLIAVACDILAVRIPARCAGKNPTEVRERAATRAERVLNAVARGAFKVEAADPATASTEPIATIAPTISCRPRRRRGLGVYREDA